MKLEMKSSPKRVIDENLTITDVLTQSSDFDMVFAELDGDHPTVKNSRSDRAYFILEGSGEVLVDNESYLVEKHDTIYITKGSPHTIKGKLDYLIITSPPFSPDFEEVLS